MLIEHPKVSGRLLVLLPVDCRPRHHSGFDFLHAVANAKILNMTTNLSSLIIFSFTGNVWWHYVIPMAAANIVGSHLGTRIALRHGSQLIRIVFILVVTALVIKTSLDAF